MRLCHYCHSEVIVDEPDWGWGDDLDEKQHFVFHGECLQEWENITIMKITLWENESL